MPDQIEIRFLDRPLTSDALCRERTIPNALVDSLHMDAKELRCLRHAHSTHRQHIPMQSSSIYVILWILIGFSHSHYRCHHHMTAIDRPQLG